MISEVPYMAEQWDFEKNTDDISKTRVNIKEQKYWKCKKCGYEWEASPVARFSSTGKCPCCEQHRTVAAGINDLLSVFPEAANSYDFKRNQDVDITTLGAGSHTQVYWRCPKCDYAWLASVKTRANSKFKCPCCDSGKVIKKGVNDVFTVVPALKEWYDFEKNADLDIYSEGINSEKVVNWKCRECGREWQTSIVARIKKKHGHYTAVGCPHYNTVKRKKHEVPSVAEVPDLIKFWDHNKNTLDPALTPSNSPERVFWICSNCGYEWCTAINMQINSTAKCKCCELHIVPRKGVSDVLTLVPEIVDSYNFEKNKSIDIYSLRLHSKTPLWWKCPDCGYEWQGSIASRHNGKRGAYTLKRCQQCYLHDINRITPVSAEPKLLKYWDFEKNKGKDVNLISANSTEVANWKCKKCGYEWQGTIKGRRYSDGACPCCEKGKAVKKGINDIVTLVPDIVDIYDSEKNKDVDIYSLGITSRKEVFWKCPLCKNEWRSPVNKRIHREKDGTLRLVNCSTCSNKGFRKLTYAEEYPELDAMFDEKRNGCQLASVKSKDSNVIKYWWNCPVCGNSFKSRVQSLISALDTRTKGCPHCSRTLLMPGTSFADAHPELMDEYDPENLISAYEAFPSEKRSVKWICRNDPRHKWEATFTVRHMGAGNCPICNRTKSIKGINTFADIYPGLTALWSPNNDRGADETRYNSSLWLKWICPTCNGEYGAYIEDVISDEESCPYCSNRRALPHLNSLQTLYPDIAALWSPNNRLTADRVLPDAHTWAKWVCPVCTGEYNARINEVVSGEADCPYCSDRLVLPGFNSFSARHPDFMAEWDLVNNYLLADPDRISDACNISVWWNCPKDKTHVYSMSPKRKLMYQKRNKESCPYCKGLRRKKRHFV